MNRVVLLLVFILACTCSDAQSIEGTWEGKFGFNIFAGPVNKLVVELSVQNDTIITGTTHLYERNNHYEHYTITGKYNPSDSTVYFREDRVLGLNLGALADNAMGNYTMKLKVTDTTMRLEGKWRENTNESLGLLNSKVWLQKRLPKKEKNDAIPPTTKTTDKNLERIPEVQKLVELDKSETDSIKIEINDNMNIDGDIVSLYFEDSLVLNKYPITAVPVVLYLSVKKGGAKRLVLAAESMGSIPPCTAHMVVTTTGNKTYELDLSGDYTQNGILEFFLKD